MATNTCAFCRSRGLPWTNHSVDVCSVLAGHKCTYCKEFGHTNSRCPKSLIIKKREEESRERFQANKKIKEETEKEETEKKTHFKANCWASITAKNISPDFAEKLAVKNAIENHVFEEKRAEEEARTRADAEKQQEYEDLLEYTRDYVQREPRVVSTIFKEWLKEEQPAA